MVLDLSTCRNPLAAIHGRVPSIMVPILENDSNENHEYATTEGTPSTEDEPAIEQESNNTPEQQSSVSIDPNLLTNIE